VPAENVGDLETSHESDILIIRNSEVLKILESEVVERRKGMLLLEGVSVSY
jgi:hypothetical protein